MAGQDYLQFRRMVLEHSAKGSTWKDHKYIKKENGKYYYPKKSSVTVPEKTRKSLKEYEEELLSILDDMEDALPEGVPLIKDQPREYDKNQRSGRLIEGYERPWLDQERKIRSDMRRKDNSSVIVPENVRKNFKETELLLNSIIDSLESSSPEGVNIIKRDKEQNKKQKSGKAYK